jgi:MFS family permease
VLFAVIAAAAAFVIAPNTTPIDRALPVVIIILAICGQARLPVVNFLIVLLLLPPIVFADEHSRLLAYGLIAAIAFAIALITAPLEQHVWFVVAGVLLLRWIPLSNVVVWRELIVLVAALALFAASRSVVLALAVALFTPAFPLRAMMIPFVVALIFAFLPKFRIPEIATAALLVMWPWSGIVARAFPAFLRAERPPEASRPVWIALGPGESVSIDAPPGSHRATVIASAANASRLRKGTLMGSIEGRAVRIGDVADFGYTRREQFFRSHNAAPTRPIDDIKDYGQSAWLHTAGLIEVPVARGSLHVAAAPSLPPGARLQIEAVDFE